MRMGITARPRPNAGFEHENEIDSPGHPLICPAIHRGQWRGEEKIQIRFNAFQAYLVYALGEAGETR